MPQVGDWGTQFGMLINYLNLNYPEAIDHYRNSSPTSKDGNVLDVKIGDLVEFYKAAKKKFDEDPVFQVDNMIWYGVI